MTKNCKHCGNEIPEGRLKALKNCNTCVECSTAERKCGFAMITGKTTYSALQIVDQKTFDKLSSQQRRRGTGVAAGVIMGENKSRTLKQRK